MEAEALGLQEAKKNFLKRKLEELESLEAELNMEASSSSAMNNWDYDVFLNFRGDTRNSFTSHLYHALDKAKINVFRDNKLKRGEEITPALLRTIERSRISLVVFSQDYASSTYCLDELVKILECKQSRGQIVQPIFYNVDPMDVEMQRGSYEKVFIKHDVEFSQKLERWKSALTKTATFAGWHIDTRHHDEFECIETIVKAVLENLHSDAGGDVFPTLEMVGEACRRNMKKILECLSNSNILKIGVYGMGGVGKTTLMTHVYNSLLQKPATFKHVYWVTVSRHVSEEFNVPKLQDLIAKTIKVDFSSEDDEKKRAAELLKELKKKGKCILIIDDLWNHFSAEKIGLPIGVNKCQLILTSRSLKVCEQMGCQEKVKVETLNDEEAWDLFREKHGIGKSHCQEIVKIAKSIVKECAGLPLGIQTMAGSMRGVDDICEWRNVLRELRESGSRKDDMEDEVFSVLKLSYIRLNDSTCQQCFLYCALYPEDHMISRIELIEYLIVEGIIQRMKSRREQHDVVHTFLNKLENFSLLEGFSYDDGRRFVKMHDLVRDMALQIMKSSGNEVMVREEAVEYWTEDLIRVSLTDKRFDTDSLTGSPKCPNLSTLLLCRNERWSWSITEWSWSIADSFFHHMPALRVLDISFTQVDQLPNSISSLTNLTALLLTGCYNLRHIPSLEKLRTLEKLDLSYASCLEAAPEGLKFLLNLRYLNFFGTAVWGLKGGILRELQHLQFLGLQFSEFCSCTPEVSWELVCLKKLEMLLCRFNDDGSYNLFVNQLKLDIQRPVHGYILVVGDIRLDKLSNEFFLNWYHRGVYIGRCFYLDYRNHIRINSPRDNQLVSFSVEDSYGIGLHVKGADELKDLAINGSVAIEFLSDVFSSHFMFQSVEKVELGYLENLHLLFRGADRFDEVELSDKFRLLFRGTDNLDEVEHKELDKLHLLFKGADSAPHSTTSMSLPPKGAFSNLKIFKISHCYKIKKLFSLQLMPNLQNLQELHVSYCSQMEEVIAAEVEQGERNNINNTTNQSICTTTFSNLPKLKVLRLEKLPELISICSGKLVCESVEKVEIGWCKKLKNIPIPLPLPSLQKVELLPKAWWESVQWDNSTNKSALLDFVSIKKKKGKAVF